MDSSAPRQKKRNFAARECVCLYACALHGLVNVESHGIYTYVLLPAHAPVVGVPLPDSGCQQQQQQAPAYQRLLERRPGALGQLNARLDRSNGHGSAFITNVLIGCALSCLASCMLF